MSEAISAKNIMSSLMKLVKNTKGSSINELRLILALERAVARIEAHTKLSKHLVFKGGFVLLKTINSDRFTRDVDALAIDLSRKQVPKLIEDALNLKEKAITIGSSSNGSSFAFLSWLLARVTVFRVPHPAFVGNEKLACEAAGNNS